MAVLCGTQTPRLIHAEDWATEDDWLVFELSQKQRRGIQVRLSFRLVHLRAVFTFT